MCALYGQPAKQAERGEQMFEYDDSYRTRTPTANTMPSPHLVAPRLGFWGGKFRGRRGGGFFCLQPVVINKRLRKAFAGSSNYISLCAGAKYRTGFVIDRSLTGYATGILLTEHNFYLIQIFSSYKRIYTGS